MTYLNEEKIRNNAVIYTDGACSSQQDGVGGWGAYIIQPQLCGGAGEEAKIYGGASQTTNNKMEMIACIKGLEFLKEASVVTLYTDSKYIVQGITGWIKGWKKNGWKTAQGDQVKNQDLWQIIDALCSKHRVTWKWVRGHSGNRGNEIADALAVKGKEEEKARIKTWLERKFEPPVAMPVVVGIDYGSEK